VKALIIKICEGKEYITQLRPFLVRHPLLVLEIGFRPVVAPDAPYGFDKEYVWGYGSEVAAATDPCYGDVVLAAYTQPFNEVDSTYYHPLYARTVQALGHAPTNVTADAAFDAWHIYETCAGHGSRAAIPLNTRGYPLPQHSPDGRPLCPRSLPMQPSYTFRHPDGYQAQIYRCPLLFPAQTDQTCDHEQFRKGPGCVKHLNLELGGQMRLHLNRTSVAYRQIYRQRTAIERINAQAKALGIERPKVRNGASVRNLNTLIYIVINLRALVRARAINTHPPAQVAALC
jgi:hypothetical protein